MCRNSAEAEANVDGKGETPYFAIRLFGATISVPSDETKIGLKRPTQIQKADERITGDNIPEAEEKSSKRRIVSQRNCLKAHKTKEAEGSLKSSSSGNGIVSSSKSLNSEETKFSLKVSQQDWLNSSDTSIRREVLDKNSLNSLEMKAYLTDSEKNILNSEETKISVKVAEKDPLNIQQGKTYFKVPEQESFGSKAVRTRKRPSYQKKNDKTVSKPDKPPMKCARCESADTKFCYYNNYNVNQPRYFCKNCRRYWTAGGTMRNIPVGAGRRKSKHFQALSEQQQQRGQQHHYHQSKLKIETSKSGSTQVSSLHDLSSAAIFNSNLLNEISSNSPSPWIISNAQNSASSFLVGSPLIYTPALLPENHSISSHSL